MSIKSQVLPTSKREWEAFALVGCGVAAWWLIFGRLHAAADWFTYQILGLEEGSRLGSSVAFFLYDVPKILMLLGGMIFVITILRTFITPEQTRRWLSGKREGIGNVLAASLGIVTPFCSCSAVPLFIGFVEAGIPLGVTFSFLVAAPMINEVALVMLVGMFGWDIAALYLVSGLSVAILSGLVIGQLKLERYVEDFVYQVKAKKGAGVVGAEQLTWVDRFEQGLEKVREIVGKVWPYVIVGIGIGAAIHGYVPEDYLVGIMGENAWWSVPVSVIIAVPIYSNAAGILPVVSVLLDKGAALGTALAFMMGVVGLSLPEMIILRRVLKPRLIAIYVAVLATGIIMTGYLFNLII